MCKLKIKFGQAEFEMEGDSESIERERQAFTEVLASSLGVIPFVESENENTTTEETLEIGSTVANEKKNKYKENMSIQEFLREKGFGSNTDKFLALAYYLEKFRDTDNFTTNDVKALFLEGKEKLPGNISDCAGKNTQKGYIQLVQGNKKNVKQYSITRSGEEFIDNYAPKNPKKAHSNKAKSNNKKGESVLSEYEGLSTEALNLDNYPPLSNFKSFKEKMMIVLYIVTKEKQGLYFSYNDVCQIMRKKFGESAGYEQVKWVVRDNKTWFDEVKDEKGVKRKLLNAGIRYAETLISDSVEIK